MEFITNLQTPSNSLIEEYRVKFDKDEKASASDLSIVKLFLNFPTNTKIEDVLLKATVINDLYSETVAKFTTPFVLAILR
jgi:hypothetical protein